MTEAFWLSLGLATAATAILSVGSVWLSRRSARRIDAMRASRRDDRAAHAG